MGPKFDKDKQLVNYQNWWDGKKVIAEGKKQTKPPTKQISFTRRDLIKLVADTDGGAHVDAAINTDYHKLRNENLLGWYNLTAYEVLNTFNLIDIARESQLK